MNARGRTLCIAVTTTFSFCAFGLGYLTWSRARCEERTLLSLNPDLRQLGAYELELSGQGYRARCRLVLRQETAAARSASAFTC